MDDNTNTETVNTFLSIIKRALKTTDNKYYSSNYWNESMINSYTGANQERLEEIKIELLPHLNNYNERVFCYELYHQIRTLMSNIEQQFRMNNIMFQAELSKRMITDKVEELLNIQRLDKLYYPDFLLHNPSDTNSQLLVIEVKTAPNITFENILYDLNKLDLFIQNYHYNRALFLVTNNNPKRILNIMNENLDRLTQIENSAKIEIYCKKKNDVSLCNFTLSELKNYQYEVR